MYEEPYLVVSLLSDDGTKMGFNTPTESASFIVTSKFNLLDILFRDLDALYYHSPKRISASLLVGNLLSSTSSQVKFCGSILHPRLIEALCGCSVRATFVRCFVELCCVVCPVVECFEADMHGKYTPLQRFVQPESAMLFTNDLELVKDITVALEHKLLELRKYQEQGYDASSVLDAIHGIWSNARILWNLDEAAGGCELAAHWDNISRWKRSTRRKQVKTDARLVLRTKLILEQGRIRRVGSTRSPLSPHSSDRHAYNRVTPLTALSEIDPEELWCAAVLAELFGVDCLSSAVGGYMHRLLCAPSCDGRTLKGTNPNALRKVRLPTKLCVEELMESRKERTALAKRLQLHFHKYNVPTECVLHDLSEVKSASSDSTDTTEASLPTKLLDAENSTTYAGHSNNISTSHKKKWHAVPSYESEASSSESESSSNVSLKNLSYKTSSNQVSGQNRTRRSNHTTYNHVDSSFGGESMVNGKHNGRYGKESRRYTGGSLSQGELNGMSNGPSSLRRLEDSLVSHESSLDTGVHSPPPRPHPYTPLATTRADMDVWDVGGVDSFGGNASSQPYIVDATPVTYQRDGGKLSVTELGHNYYTTPNTGTGTSPVLSSDKSASKSDKRTESPRRDLYDNNGRRIRRTSPTSQSRHSLSGRLSQKVERSRSPRDAGYCSAGTTASDERCGHKGDVAFGRRSTNSKRTPREDTRVSFIQHILASSTERSGVSTPLEIAELIDPVLARKRAVARVQESKKAEERESEQRKQEEALRKSRLKTVQLTAEMTRLRSIHRNVMKERQKSVRSRSAPPAGRGSRSYNSPPSRRYASSATINRDMSDSAIIRGSLDHDPKEARQRAAERIKERKAKLQREKRRQLEEAARKEKAKWETRDRKIEKFIARQSSNFSDISPPTTRVRSENRDGLKLRQNDDDARTGISSSLQHLSNRSTVSPESTLSAHSRGLNPADYINWEADRQTDHSPANVAIERANEVSSMIEAALGVMAAESQDTDPVVNSGGNENDSKMTQSGVRLSVEYLQGSSQRAPSAGPYTPTRMPADMLCVKVHRAHALPNILGGTNPYVVFTWGTLGRAATQAIRNSTSPVFNATLRFKSPAPQGSSLSEALMKSPPLVICLYSRNESVSDELLGRCSIDDLSRLEYNDKGNCFVKAQFYSEIARERTCGVVEFEIFIM